VRGAFAFDQCTLSLSPCGFDDFEIESFPHWRENSASEREICEGGKKRMNPVSFPFVYMNISLTRKRETTGRKENAVTNGDF
jgi:hypothetical protein